MNRKTIMKLLNKITTLLALGIFVVSTLAATKYAITTWEIDKTHSAINFKVTHFFTPVNGSFEDYESTIKFDPENLEESSIVVSIAVNSVNTKNERRDNDLRSDNFFETEKWPNITFKSESIEKTGDNEFVANGTLTIKDTSKEIALPFTLLGITDNPMQDNSLIAGITSSIVLNRGDFDVGTGNWASNAVIGEEVTVDINLELKAER